MLIWVKILIIIGTILQIILRIFAGLSNGAFYGKHNPNANTKMDIFIKNIHFIETPRWYIQFGSFYCLITAIILLYTQEFYWVYLLYSMIITMLISASAGSFYQGFINWGSGLPFFNKKEEKYSEFALSFFGIKLQFNWFRLWSGNLRLVTTIISIILLLLLIIIFLKNN